MFEEHIFNLRTSRTYIKFLHLWRKGSSPLKFVVMNKHSHRDRDCIQTFSFRDIEGHKINLGTSTTYHQLGNSPRGSGASTPQRPETEGLCAKYQH
jgi:hypothetical protein